MNKREGSQSLKPDALIGLGDGVDNNPRRPCSVVWPLPAKTAASSSVNRSSLGRPNGEGATKSSSRGAPDWHPPYARHLRRHRDNSRAPPQPLP